MTRVLQVCCRTSVAVLICALAGAGPARASSISLVDEFDPADVLFTKGGGACQGVDGTTDWVTGLAHGGCDTLAYSQALAGFNAGTDTVSSAILTLAFYDDGPDANVETVDIMLGSSQLMNNLVVSGSASTPSHSGYQVSSYVDEAGHLSTVLLSRGNQGARNDFYLASSTLRADVVRNEPLIATELLPVTPVPEPATLLLLGGGVLVSAAGRKFKSHVRQ